MKKILTLTALIVICILAFVACGKSAEDENPNNGIRYDGPAYVTDITDLTIKEGIATAEALEEFYRDDDYVYYFPSIRSELIECTLSDGSKTKFKEALEEGLVNISDLDFYGIKYYVEDKAGNISDGGIGVDYEDNAEDDGRRY